MRSVKLERKRSHSAIAGCFRRKRPGSDRGSQSQQSVSKRLAKFSSADWSTATVTSLLADASLREAFQDFLDSRFMGEVLRLHGELEHYSLCGDSGRPELAQDIFRAFVDQESDSIDTVTLGAELVGRIRERIDAKAFDDNLFDELETEVLLLISTNGLHDFLGKFTAPSLALCFSNPAEFAKLLEFARSKNQEAPVELVRRMLDFEAQCRKGQHSSQELQGIADEIIQAAEAECTSASIANARQAVSDGVLGDDTFVDCKDDAMQSVMSVTYPAFVQSYTTRE